MTLHRMQVFLNICGMLQVISNTTKWVILNTIIMHFITMRNRELVLVGSAFIPNLQALLKMRVSTFHRRAPEARSASLLAVCVIPPPLIRNSSHCRF
jgi:hypothetical protein